MAHISAHQDASRPGASGGGSARSDRHARFAMPPAMVQVAERSAVVRRRIGGPIVARFILTAKAAIAFAAAVFVVGPLSAEAASFTVDGNRLIISGALYGDHEFGRFTGYLRANPGITTVVMKDFFGGMTQAGSFLAITEVIRARKLTTEVDGPCVSACALAFLGGVKRGTAPGANPERSFVAFHGVYTGGGVHSDEFKPMFVNALRRYTGGKMPEKVALKAFSLPPDGFIAFFDKRRTKGKKGVSVILCEDFKKADEGGCVGVTGIDAYSAGVFTR